MNRSIGVAFVFLSFLVGCASADLTPISHSVTVDTNGVVVGPSVFTNTWNALLPATNAVLNGIPSATDVDIFATNQIYSVARGTAGQTATFALDAYAVKAATMEVYDGSSERSTLYMTPDNGFKFLDDSTNVLFWLTSTSATMSNTPLVIADATTNIHAMNRQTADARYLELDGTGSMTGDLDMNTNSISAAATYGLTNGMFIGCTSTSITFNAAP